MGAVSKKSYKGKNPHYDAANVIGIVGGGASSEELIKHISDKTVHLTEYERSKLDEFFNSGIVSGKDGSQIYTGSILPEDTPEFTFNENDLFILVTSERVTMYKRYKGIWKTVTELRGPKGDPGEPGKDGKNFKFEDFTTEQLNSLKGKDGKDFKYEDFTEEQLESLKGEDGKDFKYEDFTEEQLESLKGKDGQDADTIYPEDLKSTVTINLGGFKVGDLLSNMRLSEILEKLLCTEQEYNGLPTFLGLIDFKEVNKITYNDLISDTVIQGTVKKPITTYQYSDPQFTFGKSAIIAFPKELGEIVGVVDGAGISISGSYTWIDKDIILPSIGMVTYTIGGAKEALIYNQSSIIKWNIE